MNQAQSMILDGFGQTEDDTCYIGGKPRLPINVEIPKCSLCGTRQTFFFQVAFPDDHKWKGFTMAVFECTSCAHENFLIPEMLNGKLFGANIPRNFLSTYQKNFRFEVFKTNSSQVVNDYPECIKFIRIKFDGGNGPILGHIGGTPIWILEDESPGTYDSGTPMHFLLQVNHGFEFETLKGVQPQIELGLTGDPEPSPYDFYQLFIKNEIYFFGTDSRNLHLVYALTQVD